MNRSALLLLADSSFPAGTHAHSGGLESAAAAGRVLDPDSLHEFLVGRLHTAALLTAAFAVTAFQAQDRETVAALDRELDVRMVSPTLRAASRGRGRALIRVASGAWPGPRYENLEALDADGPHYAIALGTACAAADLTSEDAASCAVQDALRVPANAAVKLLGLDPAEVLALLVTLAPAADRVAAKALTMSRMSMLRNDYSLLPALGSPLLDLTAEEHADLEVRLFAT